MSVYTHAELERINERLALAQQRRAVLVAADLDTFTVGLDHDGRERAITCLCCGLTSYNPHDIDTPESAMGADSGGKIVHRYCGFCRKWHEEGNDR